MKTGSRWLCLMVATVAIAFSVNAQRPDENRGDSRERLERMEHQIQQLAHQQEQLQRQIGEAIGQRGPQPPRVGPEGQRPPMPAPAPGQEKHHRHGCHGAGGLIAVILFVCAVCNVLLATWVFGDIRKRGEGSGIFVALALLIGIPAVVVYSLIRIGDKRTSESPAKS